MLLNQVIFFGVLIIFFIESQCDRPKSPTEIPPSNQEEEIILSDLVMILDYVGIEIIRRNIVQHFPNDDYFFIGQPLAFVSLVMMIRDQLAGSNSGIIRLVPFSGSFFNIITNSYREHRFVRDPENYPTFVELENYRELLREYGLDPINILENYESSDRRIVIIKDVGLGLVSFLEILCSWARLEGINPNQLRNITKVFGAIIKDDGFPVASVITINEFSFDLVLVDLTTDISINTIERIAYPERNTGYVRLIQDYPHQLWNEPPQAFDLEHQENIRIFVDRFTELMRMMAEILPLFPTTTASPTLAQRSDSDIDFVCGPRERRFKRELTSQDLIKKQMGVILTSDWELLEALETEHTSSRKTSLWKFIEDQLKNSSSTLSRILKKTCEKYNYFINEEQTVLSEQVHFSSNKTSIYQCMKKNQLFRCDVLNENSEIIKGIAELTAKKLSRKITTVGNIEKEAKSLVFKSIDGPYNFLVGYLIEATRQAVLYCSDEKIRTTLECPSNSMLFLGQMMHAWFVELSSKKFNF